MKYLISFPAAAMNIPAGEMPSVSEAAHEVIREAKKARVYPGLKIAIAAAVITALPICAVRFLMGFRPRR